MRFGRKETPIDQLRGVAITALVTALQEGGALDQLQRRTLDQLQDNKKSSSKRGRGLSPVKTLAAGAVLYTGGRIAYNHRDALESLIEGVIDVDDVEEVDDADEVVEDEPEAEEDEDFDEEEDVEDEPEAEEDEDFDEEEDVEDEPEAEEDEDF